MGAGRLHDTLQQHLRALKTMMCELDSLFITSVSELKLDPDTMFEWFKHSHDKTEVVPHYHDILLLILELKPHKHQYLH